MGLSDEERIEKTYWRLLYWRKALAELRDTVAQVSDRWERRPARKRAKIVEKWIATVDELTGILSVKLERSGMYWVIGENEKNVRTVFSSTYNLGAVHPQAEKCVLDEEYESITYWERNFTRKLAAQTWIRGNFYSSLEHLPVLGAFWDMWAQVPATLYPVLRYRDAVFPKELKRRLRLMIGEMVNRRFDLIADGIVPGELLYDYVKGEQALLAKYDAARRRLEKASSKAWRSEKNPGKVKFDIYDLLLEVGNLTLAEIEKEADQEDQEKRRRANEADEAEAKKKAAEPKKIDGVFGPAPRSRDELLAVLDTTRDEKEFDAAKEELERVYQTYSGQKFKAPTRASSKAPKRSSSSARVVSARATTRRRRK